MSLIPLDKSHIETILEKNIYFHFKSHTCKKKFRLCNIVVIFVVVVAVVVVGGVVGCGVVVSVHNKHVSTLM